MIIIEAIAPSGTLLTDDETSRLGDHLLKYVAHNAPSAHVLVHEPRTWRTPKGPAGAGQWLVRVSLPAPWYEAMASDGVVVKSVTKALAAFDHQPGQVYREPTALVQVVAVPEGDFGAFGEALQLADLADLATGDLQVLPSGGIDRSAAGRPRDPVCGMVVDFEEVTITLEHDDTTYGFCSQACRDRFTEQYAEPAPTSTGARS